ncbi:MAG: sulfotransferase [Desulfobacteraceae bacterium]|jgi:hypothetical protein
MKERTDNLLPPNIVITGSFRSGTSLLFLLFPHAFRDVIISGDESDALETKLPSSFKWRVSKRPNDIHRVRVIYKKLDPYFIYMIRDPRDCLVSWKQSKNNYHIISFNEWLRNLLFAESSKSTKLIFLRFEDMIRDPIQTQNHLLERVEGLEKLHDLDQCYRYIDRDSPVTQQLSHDSGPTMSSETIRPIDPSVIGSWRHHKLRVREQLKQFPEMQAVLEKYGYEEDDSWQNSLEDV